MARGSSVTVLRDIQTLFEIGTASGFSDRQLLDRFVNRHDAEASFPAIQEEVRRIPEKYLTVVVLCYWESLTHEQAAVQLGCPVGTIRSRLARARNLLRRRLTSRGLAPLGGIVAAGLDCAPTSAAVMARNLSPVPRELVQSTIHAASRIAAGEAASHIESRFAASLVQSVLWSMTMIKIKMAIVGVVLVGLVLSGGWFGTLNGPLAQAQPKAKVSQKLESPAEKVKSTNSQKFYSLVEGQTTIVDLVPDGSTVKKGQVICTLDSSMLKDQLVNQQIATTSAAANYEKSKLAREVAEIAVVEYLEGIFQTQFFEAEGNIQIAQAELALAEGRLNAVKKAKEKGTEHVLKSAQLTALRARFSLEKAQSRKKLLVDYTKPKKTKDLQSGVEKARSEELTKKAIYSLEDAREKKLEKQIASCTIIASKDGKLVYAAPDRNRTVYKRDGSLVNMPAVIEEGATVRERQILFEIVPAPKTP
jgi:HlyD family secretion protein